MLILLAAAGLIGCSNPEYPPPDPLPDPYTRCAGSEDCVIVELGCCDACNGGTAVSVNAKSEAEVRDRYAESCGNNQACTLMACAPWEPTCDDRTCGMEQGEL